MAESNQASRAVLITAPLEEGWLQQQQNRWPDLRFVYRSALTHETVPDELWQEAEVLYMWFATPIPTPEQAPKLRWVQLYSAGVDEVLHRPLFHSQVTFTTASGVHAIAIPEYVMTMILAWSHRLPTLLELQRQGDWPKSSVRSTLLVPEELRGKTIGIVGYGSIGREVARLAHAFGMRILAMQRGSDHHDKGYQIANVGDPEGTFPERYFAPTDLYRMLAECDVVVIAIPLTPSTRGMFNEAAFAAMKSSAFLVNIARGAVCDEQALIRALQQKQIAGAALDVVEHEPLSSESPLWHLPNVLLTPHISGLTSHYNERVAALFEENLRRYLSGEPLVNVVDKTQGY
jgi:phosphoglycerate dehydrogenase-like enzyme